MLRRPPAPARRRRPVAVFAGRDGPACPTESRSKKAVYALNVIYARRDQLKALAQRSGDE